MTRAFAALFATSMFGLLAIGATLPVLPRYVTGPLGHGDITVGVVIGIFAVTAIVGRPLAGRLADARGRRLTVVLGASLSALAGLAYFLPFGVPSLLAARLLLGAGEGMVFTAGAAWVVDIAPPARRGRWIGLFGLSIWSGLALGPLIGEALFKLGSYELVWAFCAALPAAGALVASRIASPRPAAEAALRGGPILVREAIAPGAALALAAVGFAAVASFLVLHLDARAIEGSAAVFTAFAASVVLTRLIGGNLPDRLGPAPCALGAGVLAAIGLTTIGLATDLTVALTGAVVMGAGFSTLYPSLSLIVVERAPEGRRASALGTFTAFFDAGVGLGGPLAGLAATLAGYPAAFFTAAVLGAGTVILAARLMALPRLAPEAAT